MTSSLQQLLGVPAAGGRTRWPASRAARGALGGSPWVPKSSLGLDEADAEELLPEAVDGDAGRQRVVGVDQPARQRQPVELRARWRRVQRRRHARADRLALVEEVAADVDVRRPRLALAAGSASSCATCFELGRQLARPRRRASSTLRDSDAVMRRQLRLLLLVALVGAAWPRMAATSFGSFARSTVFSHSACSGVDLPASPRRVACGARPAGLSSAANSVSLADARRRSASARRCRCWRPRCC